jgi:hypothetical protein
MSKNRIASLCVAVCLCAAPAVVVFLSTGCSFEPEVSAVAASQQVAPKTEVKPDARTDAQGAADEDERAYAELDKAYQAGKRAALEELDRRRAAGEKLTEAETKSAALEYWPRFEALSSKGSGHARLWMALEMQSAFKSRDRAVNQKESVRLLDEVVAKDADAAWIGELAKSLTALYITLPEEEVDRVVDALAAKSSRKEVVAEALYRSAAFDKTSKRAGAAARADEITKRLQRDYADTNFGRKARGEENRAVGLNVGNLAPEFTTQDSEGVTFKLSDYRGKVVVLDFWGFW